METKLKEYNEMQSPVYSLPVLLDNYHPDNQEEQTFKQEMIEFLKNPDCFRRECLAGHFTGSSWIVNKDNTQALITHHKKLNMFLQLGGHCDGDDDVLRVAYKEAMEESGIVEFRLFPIIFDIDVHVIPEYKGVPEHKHYDVRFLFQVKDDSIGRLNEEESNELRWVKKEDIQSIESSYGFHRMAKKWLDLKNLDDWLVNNVNSLIYFVGSFFQDRDFLRQLEELEKKRN